MKFKFRVYNHDDNLIQNLWQASYEITFSCAKAISNKSLFKSKSDSLNMISPGPRQCGPGRSGAARGPGHTTQRARGEIFKLSHKVSVSGLPGRHRVTRTA